MVGWVKDGMVGLRCIGQVVGDASDTSCALSISHLDGEADIMDSLLRLTEEVGCVLATVEADDLSGLAGLHTHLLNIAEQADRLAADSDSAAMVTVREAGTKAAELIEKVILSEAEDDDDTLEAIAKTTASIQQLVGMVIRGESAEGVAFPEELGLPEVSVPSRVESAGGTAESPSGRLVITLPENVDEEIFAEYLGNLRHTLDSLEAAILTGERDDNADTRGAVKAILHNLKGESSLMGLEEMAEVCHDCESVLAEMTERFPGERLLGAKDWMQSAANALIEGRCELNGAVPAEAAGDIVDEGLTEQKEQQGKSCEETLVIAEGDIPLVRDFVQESHEHLESAEGNLLLIEENPEDGEVVNAIFRAFHTIKGVAGFLNLSHIGSLAHAAENLLDQARKGTLRLAGASIDVVFESIDVTKQMLSGLEEAVEQGRPVMSHKEVEPLIERIKTCVAGGVPPFYVGEILVQNGTVSREDIRSALQEQAAATGGDEPDNKKIGEILVESGVVSDDNLRNALGEQARIAKNHEVREKMGKAVAEQEAASGEQIGESVDSQGESTKSGPAPAAPSRKRAGESTVKVTTGRLDSLVNMVGELVIAQSMVSQGISESLSSSQMLDRNARHLDKITRDLQELAMSMRMVPVQGVFQKMARLVRDLSRKAGKEVEFIVTGSETELDRNVVEAIADPLVHMVRNSVDHGIEAPEDRKKAGKNAAGRVELKAYHQGGNIVIEIVDDGRGLNRERILQKAIDSGVVKPGQELSDSEVFRLIFHAGLSTAEKVTDVSGRGVGMDVVRKNIESLRGRVDIESELGKGSVFTIRLPLTLAVIDGQVVTVGTEKYIIPTVSIEQSIRPRVDQLSTVQGGKGHMLMIRGELVPLVALHELFTIDSEHSDPCESLVVVVADGGSRCCVQVDGLLGQQQVVIKSLGSMLGSIKGVSGGAIMGDGNVSLILDVPGLISLAADN